MTEETLESVARPLYEAPPDDFVASRKTLAAEARKAGDAPLARRIAALRKPTRAAWAVNLLLRSDPERVDALLALGEELRDAQEQFAGAELRALASERRTLIGEAVTSVRALADEAGSPLGEPVVDQVTQTLNAALADEAAAAALETGLLVDALSSTGFEPVDLDGKVAVPEARADKPRRRGPRKKAPAKKAPAKKAAPPKAEKKSAPPGPDPEEVARADAAYEEASRRAADARARAEEARAEVETLKRRRQEVRDALDEIETALADARTAESSARKDRAAAEREESTARGRVRAVKGT